MTAATVRGAQRSVRGGIGGMLCVAAMIPGEKLGVIVPSNMLPHQLTIAVELKIFDTFLGGEAPDWSASLKAKDKIATSDLDQRRAAQAALLPPPTTPALLIATTVLIDPRADRFKARGTSATPTSSRSNSAPIGSSARISRAPRCDVDITFSHRPEV